MIEHYHLPSAKVLSAQRIEEVATVVVEISRHDYLGYPIAPADLWRLDSNESIWPFHQLVGRDSPRFVFETYDVPSPLPQVGLTWDFCSRWLPDAMDAVRDKSISWELLLAPDDTCNRCLLTYETIAVGSAHSRGYQSKYGWITTGAYREFIQRDILRVRNHWRSIELAAELVA